MSELTTQLSSCRMSQRRLPDGRVARAPVAAQFLAAEQIIENLRASGWLTYAQATAVARGVELRGMCSRRKFRYLVAARWALWAEMHAETGTHTLASWVFGMRAADICHAVDEHLNRQPRQGDA